MQSDLGAKIHETREKQTVEHRSGNENFELLNEHSLVGYLTLNNNHLITRANLAVFRMFGIDRDTLLGKSIFDFINPSHRLAVIDFFQNLDNSTEVDPIDLPVTRKDGAILWIELHVISGSTQPVASQNIDSVIIDITKRKVAEVSLQKSLNRFQDISSLSQEWLWEVDIQGRYTFSSQSVKSILGYSQEEILEKHFYDVFHPDDREELKLAAFAVFSARKPFHEFYNRNIHKNGRTVWLVTKAIPILDEKGDLVGYRGTDLDVSKHVEAIEELRENHESFRSLFESSPIPIWEEDFSLLKQKFKELDASGVTDFRTHFDQNPDLVASMATWVKVVKMNSISANFFEVEAVHEIPSNLAYFFSDESRSAFIDELVALASGKDRFISEIPIRSLKGGGKTIMMYLSVVPGFEESLSRVLVSFVDLTDRREAEKKLRDLATHIQEVVEEERKKIALNLHDDLGQKLTALNIDLAWLSHKIPATLSPVVEKVNDMKELLVESLNTVKKMSSDLRPAILDDLGIVSAIHWQADEFSKLTGIKCDVSILPEELTMNAEISIQVFRILQESLTNITRHANASKVLISLVEKQKNWRLRIKDNGSGICMEEVAKSKSFGLIGIRERSKLLSGVLTISGEKNKGTEIILEIPFSKEEENDD